jgi:hypothetical protein
MLRIFFDTEFTDLAADAKLISIGMVDETGERSFYAELADTYHPDDVSEFVTSEVLPHLEGGPARMTMEELRKRLTTWLEAFGEPVQLATDSLAWDWPWIHQIFRVLTAVPAWPKNLHPSPLVLTMNYLIDFDNFEAALEQAFADGLRRHHALDDAKANRLGWIAAGGDIERATGEGGRG